MISAFDIYLIGTIDSVRALFFILGSAFLGLVVIFAMFEKDKDVNLENTLYFREICWFFCIGIIFLITSFFIPSSKTLASMMIIPPVVNSVSENKQIQQIPQAVLGLIKSYENNADDNSK